MASRAAELRSFKQNFLRAIPLQQCKCYNRVSPTCNPKQLHLASLSLQLRDSVASPCALW